MRSQANTPGRVRNSPAGTSALSCMRGASAFAHCASRAASNAVSGRVQNTRQWCLLIVVTLPASCFRSASRDFAPSSFATEAMTMPPAATALQALASKARASSRWRGGSTSTSGNFASGKASSSSMSAPIRCRRSASGLNGWVQAKPRVPAACSAAPSRARRNRASPACGQRSRPPSNGCIRASRALSRRLEDMRAV